MSAEGFFSQIRSAMNLFGETGKIVLNVSMSCRYLEKKNIFIIGERALSVGGSAMFSGGCLSSIECSDSESSKSCKVALNGSSAGPRVVHDIHLVS